MYTMASSILTFVVLMFWISSYSDGELGKSVLYYYTALHLSRRATLHTLINFIKLILLFFPVFDVVPVNTTCPANDVVTFNCSVREGEILWYVNGTYALGLPLAYQTFFKTTSRDNRGDAGENSTLQFIATPEANNSRIMCAVFINNETERDPRATAVLIGKIY